MVWKKHLKRFVHRLSHSNCTFVFILKPAVRSDFTNFGSWEPVRLHRLARSSGQRLFHGTAFPGVLPPGQVPCSNCIADQVVLRLLDPMTTGLRPSLNLPSNRGSRCVKSHLTEAS